MYNEDCYKAATGSMRTWQEGEDHCRYNNMQNLILVDTEGQ